MIFLSLINLAAICHVFGLHFVSFFNYIYIVIKITASQQHYQCQHVFETVFVYMNMSQITLFVLSLLKFV